MKKIFLSLVLICTTIIAVNAQNLQEVVYFKNGSAVRGVIIEQTPNKLLKIQTSDGSISVYKMSDISKITKESNLNATRSQTDGLLSSNDKGIQSGYKGFVDFGYAFGTGDFGVDRIEFLTSHGVQFNPYIFAGLGAGINYYTDGELVGVPVFADIKGTFIKGNITPFIDLKIGYSFVDVEGFYMNPSIGCRFGVGKTSGLNISLGYVMQKLEYYSYYYGSGNVTCGGISLKFGIDF